MGRVFRKKRNGKESGPYVMRYRLADGHVVERSTRCRERKNAETTLREAEQREEKIRAGILTAGEVEAQDWADVPVASHVKDYLRYLKGKGVSEKHMYERRRCLSRVLKDCRLTRLGEFSRQRFERWLLAQADEGMGNRTRNTYRAALLAFAGWMVKQGRMLTNPFEGVEAANERVDKRRQRRVLTDEEIARLLDTAEARPLHEALHGNRGDGPAKLSESTRWRLEWRGHERSMCYAVMLGTGLRYGEARGLRFMDVVLDGPAPHLTVAAETEKARRGAQIPLMADLRSKVASPTLPEDLWRPSGPHRRLENPFQFGWE